jgi:hypothetical protein
MAPATKSYCIFLAVWAQNPNINLLTHEGDICQAEVCAIRRGTLLSERTDGTHNQRLARGVRA